MKYDAIVVGAGITGAATAYYLKKCGLDQVLLVDKSGPAAGGTTTTSATQRQSDAVASARARPAAAPGQLFKSRLCG